MRLAVLLLLSTFLLLGCQASFDDQKEESIKAVQKQMNEKPKGTNKEAQDINFYLPFGYEIDEESPNNIILKNGSKTYILFYNQFENQQSDVVYKSTLNQHEKYEIDQKWEDKDNFGYFLVKKLEDDLNELIVGIGGVKLTSEVKTSSLTTEAVQMMEIVNSVSIKSKEE
jgi:5-formyltetrahydrofolate cyclo-ligase